MGFSGILNSMILCIVHSFHPMRKAELDALPNVEVKV